MVSSQALSYNREKTSHCKAPLTMFPCHYGLGAEPLHSPTWGTHTQKPIWAVVQFKSKSS